MKISKVTEMNTRGAGQTIVIYHSGGIFSTAVYYCRLGIRQKNPNPSHRLQNAGRQ